jgi:hypothetical protein
LVVAVLVVSCGFLRRERQSLVAASDRIAELSVAGTNSLAKLDRASTEAEIALRHTTALLDSMAKTVNEVQPDIKPLVVAMTALADSYRDLAVSMKEATDEFRKHQKDNAPILHEIFRQMSYVLAGLAGVVVPLLVYGLKRYVFGNYSLPDDWRDWRDSRRAAKDVRQNKQPNKEE